MMEELQKHGNMTVAAVRSGMDQKTAQKYRDAAKLPSEMTKERHWRIKNNAYSLPSRLRGESVRVRLFDDRLEIRHAGELHAEAQRLLGDGGQHIDYRHIIWSLVQKPGAFRRYRYREELFPTPAFRQAYDALAVLGERDADLHYLRILHLAASAMQSDVEIALALLLEGKTLPRIEAVKEICLAADHRATKEVPALTPFSPELAHDDELLGVGGAR